MFVDIPKSWAEPFDEYQTCIVNKGWKEWEQVAIAFHSTFGQNDKLHVNIVNVRKAFCKQHLLLTRSELLDLVNNKMNDDQCEWFDMFCYQSISISYLLTILLSTLLGIMKMHM